MLCSPTLNLRITAAHACALRVTICGRVEAEEVVSGQERRALRREQLESGLVDIDWVTAVDSDCHPGHELLVDGNRDGELLLSGLREWILGVAPRIPEADVNAAACSTVQGRRSPGSPCLPRSGRDCRCPRRDAPRGAVSRAVPRPRPATCPSPAQRPHHPPRFASTLAPATGAIHSATARAARTI